MDKMTSSVLAVVVFGFTLSIATGIEDKQFWMNKAQDSLREALKMRDNHKQAKNIILFLGDGMGISTITAARIYKGQLNGQTGEENRLTFERFPNAAFSKTYTVDRQTADSAGAGTAIVSGVKVNFGTIGFDARVKRRNCSLVDDPSVRVETLLDWSLLAGKSAGIITTARVTHASPAATYAHSADRNWETDNYLTNYPGCNYDIAKQLIDDNPYINVVLGGGRRNFKNRADGRNLTSEWLQRKLDANKAAKYVETAEQFRNVDASNTDYLLGMFTESHMTWDQSRDPTKEPSISEMTAKAIEILKKNDKGFFLFVEGARIDHGHHDNWAKRALTETIAMDDAVGVAVNMTGDDTLIVITADHSHPFNIVGYPKRGNKILGLVDPVDPGQAPTDGKPYSTLIYADGPGPNRSVDLSTMDTFADDFQFPRAVPMADEWETHGGEDVGIFARGPMSHLFHGVHEENYIAHVMAYAACVGPNTEHCDGDDGNNDDSTELANLDRKKGKGRKEGRKEERKKARKEARKKARKGQGKN